MFVGKVSPPDLRLLSSLADAGLLARPALVPPPFDSAAELTARLRLLPHAPHRMPPPHLPAGVLQTVETSQPSWSATSH
jgi:hypothetical protein